MLPLSRERTKSASGVRLEKLRFGLTERIAPLSLEAKITPMETRRF